MTSWGLLRRELRWKGHYYRVSLLTLFCCTYQNNLPAILKGNSSYTFRHRFETLLLASSLSIAHPMEEAAAGRTPSEMLLYLPPETLLYIREYTVRLLVLP